MRRVLMCLVVVPGLLVGTGAMAQEGGYFGIQYSRIEYQEQGFQEVNPTAIGVTLGQRINPNLAAEVRLGMGLTDDEVSVLGIPICVELDNYLGVYVKGIAPLADDFALYGLVGFTRGQLTASALGYSVSETDTDLSFGFGADVKATDTVSLSVEWARLLSESQYDLNALSIGVRFGL